MNKNKLPVKWMLGVLIVLMAVAYWATRQAQSKGEAIWPVASYYVSLPNHFLKFLETLTGFGHQGPLSGEASSGLTARGHVKYRTTQNVSPGRGPSEAALNAETSQATGSAAEQGLKAVQGENNSGNTQGINAESSLEMNAENNSGINTEYNQEINAENPEYNQEINAETAPGNNTESNAENTPGSNAVTTPETFSENNSNNNTGSISESTIGNNPECWPGCYPHCSPSCYSGGNPGNVIFQTNLPTINPLPSNPVVSQHIAVQNQQNDSLSALLASRDALVAPVLEQAQASKYQTIDAASIPAPSTNQAPADIVLKVKTKQLSLH